MPIRRNKHGYTVVQSSHFGINGNPQFARGLQSAPLASQAEAVMVRTIGGKVFRTFQEAEMFAEGEQYPASYGGTTPIAQGQFAFEKVVGLSVYIPPPQDDE